MAREVYKLNPIIDVPEYEGFSSTAPRKPKTPASLTWDALLEWRDGRWNPRQVLPNWKPVKVTGRVRAFNDYPCVSTISAFSHRAIHALRDLLEPNGELLPLISDVGAYFAYNILTSAHDALDVERSDIQWVTKPTMVSQVKRYIFDPEGVKALSIFIVPEDPMITFVTDVFVRRVQEHGLNGFSFVKLWPLPDDVDWWDLQKQQWKKEQSQGLPSGQTVKGNTVVIRLSLQDSKSSHPNPAEQQKISQLMDQLDAILVEVKSKEPGVGSLEGRDEIVGETRLFLTCPNADALVDRLRPWLRKLVWPQGFSILKRYGEYGDPNAPEEYTDDLKSDRSKVDS